MSWDPSAAAVLTPEIGAHVQRAMALSERFRLTPITKELAALGTGRRSSRLRVAVVGEFGRGKSVLVNHLAGAAVVPANVPFPVVVSVVAGEEDLAELAWADGRTETRPLGGFDWRRLVDSGDAGALRALQVRADRELLRRLDLEILDTPGLQLAEGDVPPSELRRLLGTCDAALMVVAATSPLSLSEVALLKEDVIGSHTSKITVVISKLDLIEPAERSSVLSDLQRRVRRVSDEVDVLASPSSAGGGPELDSLHALLGRLATSNERRQWRSRQVIEQLGDHVRDLARIGERGVAAAQLSAEQRTAAADSARKATERRLTDWIVVRRQLDQRRLHTMNRASAAIEQTRSALLESMRRQLVEATDPKAWWDWEFPRILAQERATLTERYEDQLQQDVRADLAWLDAQLQERFGVQAGEWTVRLTSPAARQTAQEPVKLQDLTYLRRIVNFLPIAARRLVDLLLLFGANSVGSAPVAMGLQAVQQSEVGAKAGEAVAHAAEQLGKAAVERGEQRQRTTIARQLEVRVTRTANTLSEQLSAGLRVLYGDIITQLEDSQRTWQATQLLALQRPEEDQPPWRELAEAATRLYREIDAGLMRP